MNREIEQLIAEMKALELQLEAEFAILRTNLKFRLNGNRAVFEKEILRAHRELRVGMTRYVLNAGILHIVTAPITYALIIPFVLLDLCVTTYQWICFPVYGIEKVKRSDYLIFDRYHPAYLNVIEKINCAYCSYCNGVAGYVREIAVRTEQYWCPIKHARRVIAAHERYQRFAEFGDADGYQKHLGEPK